MFCEQIENRYKFSGYGSISRTRYSVDLKIDRNCSQKAVLSSVMHDPPWSYQNLNRQTWLYYTTSTRVDNRIRRIPDAFTPRSTRCTVKVSVLIAPDRAFSTIVSCIHPSIRRMSVTRLFNCTSSRVLTTRATHFLQFCPNDHEETRNAYSLCRHAFRPT